MKFVKSKAFEYLCTGLIFLGFGVMIVSALFWEAYQELMFAAGVIILIAGYWGERKHLAAWNADQPVVTTAVRIVLKERKSYKNRYRADTQVFELTFKPEDRSPAITLKVPEIEYDHFRVGDTGTLRYQGTEYLSFNRGPRPVDDE